MTTAVLEQPRTRTLTGIHIGMSWFNEKPGGLDRYFAELLKHLPDAGVAGRGYVMGSDRAKTESGGAVIAAALATARPWSRYAAVRRCVAADLATGTIDFVASHHALYTLPILPQIRHVPLVVHFHGPYSAECSAENTRRLQNGAKRWMEKTVYSRAARCVTLSQAFADILHRDYSVPVDKIHVVPGAVETDRFDPAATRPEARDLLGWPTHRPTIFCVRRLFRRMGLENLIDAVGEIRKTVPDVLVMIAGKGWMADELRRRITDAGLTDHVRLLGFVPDADLPLAYRAADLTVVPTVSLEGFGLTTVESLAAGTPAVVTNVGGSPEVVRDLSTDLIVDELTSAALADRLTAALTGAIRLPTADECQAFARDRYDWASVASQVRDVYQLAVNGART